MKYQLVCEGTKNAMRLQLVGLVLGTPAMNIKKGDSLLWNFGVVSKVERIIKETAKTIVIESSYNNYPNKLYQRRLKKDRLVCILK